jgi:hypothetical protein
MKACYPMKREYSFEVFCMVLCAIWAAVADFVHFPFSAGCSLDTVYDKISNVGFCDTRLSCRENRELEHNGS